MKIAIAYSSKNRLGLTKQTLPKPTAAYDLFWNDGSTDGEARDYFEMAPTACAKQRTRVTGGADPAIVFALTQMLKGEYDYCGLWENDVLPDDGWLEPTMALFERGRADGLEVGAVSARCYEDRILIQRDGHAVCHNLGAGLVIFSRRAAEIVLEFYRTGWWPEQRAVFSTLSGLDIGQWGAFRTYDQMVTCDWSWDAILAAHGLASLALTPSPVQMVGQEPSLEEQGLRLATGPVEALRNEAAFAMFRHHTRCVREGAMLLGLSPWLRQRASSGATYLTYFAHQLPRIGATFSAGWKTKWAQSFGGFSYVAEAGAVMTAPMFGPCIFVISGGATGAKVRISDAKSGYEIAPEMEPEGDAMRVLSLQMPGGMAYRDFVLEAGAGARLFAIQTTEQQPWFPQVKFDYSSLPKVE